MLLWHETWGKWAMEDNLLTIDNCIFLDRGQDTCTRHDQRTQQFTVI